MAKSKNKDIVDTTPNNKIIFGMVFVYILISSIVVVYYSMIYKPKETSCDIDNSQTDKLTEHLNQLAVENENIKDEIDVSITQVPYAYKNAVDREILNLRTNYGKMLIMSGIKTFNIDVNMVDHAQDRLAVACFNTNDEEGIQLLTDLRSDGDQDYLTLRLLLNEGKSNALVLKSKEINVQEWIFNESLPKITVLCTWSTTQVGWSIFGHSQDRVFVFQDKKIVDVDVGDVISVYANSRKTYSTITIRTLKNTRGDLLITDDLNVYL
jgi:hypothetical protein